MMKHKPLGYHTRKKFQKSGIITPMIVWQDAQGSGTPICPDLYVGQIGRALRGNTLGIAKARIQKVVDELQRLGDPLGVSGKVIPPVAGLFAAILTAGIATARTGSLATFTSSS